MGGNMTQAGNSDHFHAGLKWRRSGRDRRATDRRVTGIAATDGDMDALTGLYSGDAWNRILAAEDERCERYGHTSCIVSIELEGPGIASADLICRAGLSIRVVTKERDFVARVGTEKFAVLVAESCSANSCRVVQRIRIALNRVGVAASIGLAMRLPEKGLQYAFREAFRAKPYRVP